jgi:hypothetical protein
VNGDAKRLLAEKARAALGNHRKEYENHPYRDLLTHPDAPTTYCFKARCFPHLVKHCFQLTKVYRQRDLDYLSILSEVRDGRFSDRSRHLLESRLIQNVLPAGSPIPDEYTVLYTHRDEVEKYNAVKIEAITGDQGYAYHAGDRVNVPALEFMLKYFQAPPMVWVKVGTRVMLKRNLTRSLVNGSCGTVVGFTEVFAKDVLTNLYHPIEGCVMDKAAPPDMLARVPPTPAYQLPMGTAAVSIEDACPRRILQMLSHVSPMGKDAPPDSASPVPGFETVSVTKLASFRDSGFYPLPVVHFDNGPTLVMTPVEWKIEEKRRRARPTQSDLFPGDHPKDSNYDTVKLVSRVQVFIGFPVGWITSLL